METPAGLGSGILVEGGYVVTNYHVVWPFDSAWVVFPDGTELSDVPVVGWDPLVDLAVLGPVTAPAPFLRLADGEDLPPGSELFLVGYPAEVDLEPEVSITGGILSRLREWPGAEMTYLQSDAAIAGGQSGGALVDSLGRVVGISTYGFSEAGFTLATSAADNAKIVQRLVAESGGQSRSDRRDSEPGRRQQEATLDNLWDTALFHFESQAGSLHSFSIDGHEDGRLIVADSLGVILEVDDYLSGTEWGEVEMRSDGVHFLEIDTFSDTGASFTVDSTVPLKRLLDSDDGRRIEVGQTLTGTIDHYTDSDWYSIELRKGDTVRVSTDSIGIDTLLVVDPPDDSLDAIFDDDSGSESFLGDQTNSELVFSAPSTGTYTVVVRSFDDLSFGGYILSVELSPDGTATSRFDESTVSFDDEYVSESTGRDPIRDADGHFDIVPPVGWMFDYVDPDSSTWEDDNWKDFLYAEGEIESYGLVSLTLYNVPDTEFVDFEMFDNFMATQLSLFVEGASEDDSVEAAAVATSFFTPAYFTSQESSLGDWGVYLFEFLSIDGLAFGILIDIQILPASEILIDGSLLGGKQLALELLRGVSFMGDRLIDFSEVPPLTTIS